MQTFETVLEFGRGGGAFVFVPADVLRASVDLRSSTMSLGDGRVCVGVHKAVREAAGVAFGDRILMSIERDDAPREISIPEELRRAQQGDDIVIPSVGLV